MCSLTEIISWGRTPPKKLFSFSYFYACVGRKVVNHYSILFGMLLDPNW